MKIASSPKLERVALIQPVRKGRALPVNLLSLASYIKSYGYQPIIIDLQFLPQDRINPSGFFEQAAKYILGHCPQVLGFSVVCNSILPALLIAQECKKLAPELPVIFGGPEVSFEEVEVLKIFKQVDVIVRGEGEITLLEVLRALEGGKDLSNVLGITFRDNDRVKRNPDRPFVEDLDQLPFLEYSLVPRLKAYEALVEAGRGCPFRCTFCSTCRMWKRNFRIKSPPRLAQEVREAYRIYKKEVSIIHDHFLASRGYVEEFLSLIANEGLVWSCGSRLEAIDEKLINKLKQAGCCEVSLGIETGSPTMQKQIKKNLPLAQLPRMLEILSRNKIHVVLGFIIGFPEETESQINETLRMALYSKTISYYVTVQLNLCAFFKGSELYNNVKNKFGQYNFLKTIISPLTTDPTIEVSLLNKFPYIFPSFYYIGNDGIPPKILQKTSFLFLFLLNSYARPTLSLLEYLSTTPFRLGQKLISFFDAQGVDWSPAQGDHFPQFVFPFRKFIQVYASPLYKEFFWWDEAFKRCKKRHG